MWLVVVVSRRQVWVVKVSKVWVWLTRQVWVESMGVASGYGCKEVPYMTEYSPGPVFLLASYLSRRQYEPGVYMSLGVY